MTKTFRAWMFFSAAVNSSPEMAVRARSSSCGINCIDWQKILTGVGAGIDPAAVAREVDQGGRILIRSVRQRGQAVPDGGLGCIVVEQSDHVLRAVSAVDRVDQHEFDLTCILDLRQPSDVLVVGDAHDKGMSVVHQIHGLSLNSEMSVSWDMPTMPASYTPEGSRFHPDPSFARGNGIGYTDVGPVGGIGGAVQRHTPEVY